MAAAPIRIDIRQLRPGLYVSLGDRWLDHAFIFSSFRIANDVQIAKIRAMGVTHIDYFPDRSTATPLPLPDAAPTPPDRARLAAAAAAQAAAEAAQRATAEEALRRARKDRVAQRRVALAKAERAYRRSIGTVKTVMSEVFVAPREAGEKADALVQEIVQDLLSNTQSVIQLMSDGPMDGGPRYHALNVMILSLLLGRAATLPAGQLRAVGLGALLHDLGKVQVNASVLRIDGPARNRHEESAYRQHVEYGVVLARQLGIEDPSVLEIVRHHHERLDGSGWPDGRAGGRISLPTRIVAIANRFDGLCHPIDPARGLTPSEALATMYRQEATQLDPVLLQRFIKCMGIWPPGTVVQLSNGAIGLVIGVEPADTLRPTVLLADLAVPRSEALIVDLREAEDVKVVRAIRPADLDRDILGYLSPRMRTNVYVAQDVR
jgi:putative nucleotidyltransferase with HDIG domain